MEQDKRCIHVLGGKAVCVSTAVSFQIAVADICEFSVDSLLFTTANARTLKTYTNTQRSRFLEDCLS